MRRDMNLESWRVFAAVARSGGITAASPSLGMDPPAISRVLSSLESAVGGTPLFDRSSHSLALTESGRLALQTAEQMLTLHDELMRGLQTDTEQMSGTVRVGIPQAVLQDFAMPFLVDFARRYPEIHLEASEYSQGLPVSFASPSGPLDVVISFGPDTAHPNFVQIHYGTGRTIACASPVYLARYGVPKTPEDLVRHIGVRFNSPLRGTLRELQRGGRTVPLRFGRELSFNSVMTAKAAVLIGAGIQPDMADIHCYREIMKGSLVPVLKDWRGEPLDLYIYTRPEILRFKRVKTFIDEFRREITATLRLRDKALRGCGLL